MTQVSNDLLPYYDGIRRYALRVTGSPHDADDVAQEVCLRYLKSGESNPECGLRAYLYRTAKNIMIDQYRRHKLRLKVFTDENGKFILMYQELHVPPATPDQNVQKSEMLELIRQKANQLSPQKQEILHLRYDEDLKAKEIAEIVGLTYGNVRRILSETIAQLSMQLNTYK